MQLHFDPLGGIAGDMVVAALLDLKPDLEVGLVSALALCPLLDGVTVEVRPHGDGILTGRRFIVSRPPGHHDDHRNHHEDYHHHHHTAWREIRAALASSRLAAGVIGRAIDIFTLLAEAEARVHGVAPEDVHFHEVGAWDSIADIVAAAWLIDALAVTGCSTSPLPLGSGRVMTAHGPLPVPAPATALLLHGFETIDDGIAGERVTPTGAAILRHLRPRPEASARRLAGTGFGFGSRKLPGVSNCLRVLALAEPEADDARGRIAVVEFEIDDQSAEDLAIGLDRLRERAGVVDVVQAPVFGKKGRLMTHVRMLVRPEALDAAISAVFDETTTIGMRHRIVERSELRREPREVEVGGRSVRVKSVDRPGGRSHKAEADDAAREGDRGARERLRRAAEKMAEGS